MMKIHFFLLACILNISEFCISQTNYSISDSVDSGIISRQPQNTTICGNLSVLPYNQLDGNWATEVIGYCNDCDLVNNVHTCNIGNAGCALTCMAMLLHANGEKINPPMLNDFLLNTINGYVNCGINWEIACKYPENSTTPVFEGFGFFSLITIRSNIEANNPVIMIVGGHFIIIVGYTGTGFSNEDFIVINPGGGGQRRLSYYNSYCLGSSECLRLFSNVNAPCIPENPPAHCSNCKFEPELGEIGEDCGGICPPCSDNNYKKTYTAISELQSENIATHIINVESSNSLLSIENEKIFLCAEEIEIKNDVIIPFGSDVSFSLSGNRNKLTRDCDDWCIFTPNITSGDYYVRVTNIEYIDFTVFDIWGNEVKDYQNSLWYDGLVYLFDMSGLGDGVYYFVANFYPCNNYEPEPRTGSITVL